MTRPVLVMGVSAAGKTVVGRALAAALRAEFVDADDFHPPTNRERMAAGIPLTDEDRWPWLEALADTLRARTRSDTGVVLACSALRRAYRDILRRGAPSLRTVCLTADAPTLRARLDARRDHFMPASLLDSQLATLELPGADEDALIVDASAPRDRVLAEITDWLTTTPAA